MTAPLRVKKVRPGDDALTYCGRCKAERTHQVVALNADGTPATVICRTCGGQRRFREKKEASASTRAPRRPARRDATPEAPAGPARPYSPRETYADGDWIDHPKFGPGKVTQARSGKIEVRFDSGVRVLLHAG
ncbi:MAG TPA: hypothetical protein VN228_10555 [Pyrinomonadaceae bacterium]|nr:hypothetical protein [Pyrinomonadaceae bacterium]